MSLDVLKFNLSHPLNPFKFKPSRWNPLYFDPSSISLVAFNIKSRVPFNLRSPPSETLNPQNFQGRGRKCKKQMQIRNRNRNSDNHHMSLFKDKKNCLKSNKNPLISLYKFGVHANLINQDSINYCRLSTSCMSIRFQFSCCIRYLLLKLVFAVTITCKRVNRRGWDHGQKIKEQSLRKRKSNEKIGLLGSFMTVRPVLLKSQLGLSLPVAWQ